MRHFPAENGFLAFAAKGILPELTRCTDDAMTGDQQRNGVPANRCADGAGCFWGAYRGGDALVRHQLSGRDAQQGFPDLYLKIRASQVEGQGRSVAGGGEDALDESLRVGSILYESRISKICFKLFEGACGIEGKPTNATFGGDEWLP